MWASAFNEDDPLSPKLADEYGIVMGTSHHEPMMRAQQEWKRHGTGPWDYASNGEVLRNFWRFGVHRNKSYEEITTIGMRGDGDMAMSASTNTALLERIVSDQRKILAEEVNPDVTKIPQVWALYEEVQAYYDAGMRVPDDVTLLWCDDNWGNIRRLPTPEERRRAGGSGIYYHFDYVGDPRNYKWLLTYHITKIWEQMHLAAEYGADRIWVVNVGDLKPMEFPIEFFLTIAREPDRWSKDELQEYTREWATREFGSEHAQEIASLLDGYTHLNSRRKPEQLESTTFSFMEDHEADRVEAEWRRLAERAERLNVQLSERQRPAFCELVLYPLNASAVVNEIYVAAGRNQLYARQGRASANHWADQTRALFAADAQMSYEYNHKLLNGKWNHMMDQTHIGYTYWQQPPVNAMRAVQQVRPLEGAHMLVFPEGADPERLSLPVFDEANDQTRTIEIANRGSEAFHFSAAASTPWIRLSSTSGVVGPDASVGVTIDWSQLPQGLNRGSIVFKQENARRERPVSVAVQALKPAMPQRGFIERNGFVSIEAEHFSANRSSSKATWQRIPGFGTTFSGMEAFPGLAPSSTDPGDSACLDYEFTIWESGLRTVQSVLAPTLTFIPGRGLRYSIAIDNQTAKITDAWANDTVAEWSVAVSDGVHRVVTPLGNLAAGVHTLHFCRVDPGVVLERLVIYGDKPPTTYLGPPESARASP